MCFHNLIYYVYYQSWKLIVYDVFLGSIGSKQGRVHGTSSMETKQTETRKGFVLTSTRIVKPSYQRISFVSI